MLRATVIALVAALGAAAPAPASDIDDLEGQAASLRRHASQKDLAGVGRKLGGSLRALAQGQPTAPPPGPLVPFDPARTDGNALRIRIQLASATDADIAKLVRRGLDVTHVERATGMVEGVVSPDSVLALAKLGVVRSIRPVLPGRTRTGSVTSEGDAAANAPAVRAAGYDGTGVTVGVISDGIDSLSVAQATGDLPAVTVPADPRCRPGEGDEGTALLEIVHDLAPGANLLFSGGLSSGQFADAVRCLTDAGADVIVDDIGFFDEPFFADGLVASAARAAVNAGVSFHSAAGNDGDQHYEASYRASPSSSFHDFLGGAVDNTNDMLVAPFDTVLCVLQWDDAFGRSANDYDLYLADASLNVVADSLNVQSGTQDPLEFAGVVNTSSSYQILKVAIDRWAGATRRLEMFCLGGLDHQYLVPQGSIFGHPGVPEVVAVGAVDVLDPGLNDVEPFSSRGPARIAFPGVQVRSKPDLVAFDGVSISNAGGFPLCPPFCDFFGTSAAAPHSAAVAALLRDKDPRLGPADVRSVLTASAADIGPSGFDDTSGAGRLDAHAAGQLVIEPECFVAADCNDQDACTTDACNAGVCGHSAIACDDDDVCDGAETCDPGAGCVPGTPLECTDDNECTTDTCDAALGCRSAAIGGFSGVDCELGRLLTLDLCEGSGEAPASSLVASKVGRARSFVGKAATAPKVGKRRKLIGKADRQLRALQKKLDRLALAGDLDPACAAAIAGAVGERRGLVGGLRP